MSLQPYFDVTVRSSPQYLGIDMLYAKTQIRESGDAERRTIETGSTEGSIDLTPVG